MQDTIPLADATRHPFILTIGEILAEFFATKRGQTFLEAGLFEGPFAAGAPAIFIAQTGALGAPCGMISAVGRDDFGTLATTTLGAFGVDTAAIAVDPDLPTGTSFVRYDKDGARDFLFNIRHSACAAIALDGAARAMTRRSAHLHVVGSSFLSERMGKLVVEAIGLIKEQGGTVSLDPNIRKEILHDPARLAILRVCLEQCDVFLPSGEELTLLTAAKDEAQAVREILALGVRAIVHKRGEKGARYYDHGQTLEAPVFVVEEIDPTGAGDCFGAAFITFWLRGDPLADAITFASAAGARAVSVAGAMAGIAHTDALRLFIEKTPRRG